MSRKKYSFELYEDVLAMLRRKWSRVIIRDCELSSQDCSLVHESIGLMALLWTDCIGQKYFSRRDVLTWVANICATNLENFLDQLEYADELLIRNEATELEDFISLMRDHGGWVFIAPLRSKLDSFFAYAKIGRADELQEIRSCLLFLSRLTLTSHKDAEKKALVKFHEVMQKLPDLHTLPTDAMKAWCASIFPKSEKEFLDKIFLHHGNGSVAEQKQGLPLQELDKWRYCNTVSTQFLLKKMGAKQLPLSTAPSNRTSRLSLVPKGIDSKRVICMEPAGNMFLQQGIATGINYFFRHSSLRKHVNLRDQSLNTSLALEGSISRKYSTIDLSSASDSVRWDFVYSLFERIPYLQRLLILSRSVDRVEPDGSVLPNAHFAPMGSALCFPIEVTVFCAIVEEAIRQSGGNPSYSRYRVYGDDIIVEEEYTAKTVELLDYYGFVVNSSKSFWGEDSPFRESCGGHYFNGWDVTPFRLSRWFTTLTKAPAVVSGWIDLANRSMGRFAHLHDVVAGKVLHLFNYEIAVTTDINDTTHLHVQQVYPDFSEHEDVGGQNWYQYPLKESIDIVLRPDNSMCQATDALRYWKALNCLGRSEDRYETAIAVSNRNSAWAKKLVKCI